MPIRRLGPKVTGAPRPASKTVEFLQGRDQLLPADLAACPFEDFDQDLDRRQCRPRRPHRKLGQCLRLLRKAGVR